MSTSEQLSFNDMPEPRRGMTDDEMGKLAYQTAQNAHPDVADKPDSTDRWLAERGGGERPKTAAVDPPRFPKPDSRPVSPRAGQGRDEARTEDYATYARTSHLTGSEPLDEGQAERNRRGRALVAEEMGKRAASAVVSGHHLRDPRIVRALQPRTK